MIFDAGSSVTCRSRRNYLIRVLSLAAASVTATSVIAEGSRTGANSAVKASGRPGEMSKGDRQVSLKKGYTECRFGQLHYLRGVPGRKVQSKPPLVLLHQNSSSQVEYAPLVWEMAQDREVVAFDTPGNGMSDLPPEPPGFNGYVDAFADGIASMGLAKVGPIDVFGYHTGTLLAAELAITHPAMVGRLVLSDIPFHTPEVRKERLAKIDKRARLADDGKEILGQLQHLWTFNVTNRDPRVSLERAVEVYLEKIKPLDKYWWSYQGVWKYEVKDRFPLIRQPTLVLEPKEGLLVENSRRAAELIHNSRFVELPGLGRDVFSIGAAQYAEQLRRFLD